MSQVPSDDSADVLYITYRSPRYVHVSLPRLLESVGAQDRVWIWHNGDDGETLAAAREYESHERVHRFHHSPENLFVRGPTNWMWRQATGAYLSKVDDDALMAPGWVDRLREAHEANPSFGVIGCWRFLEEDFVPSVGSRKLERFEGGYGLLKNLWVEGSGYLMKRECLDALGELRPNQGFSQYCIDLARLGWRNGWLHPFLYQEDLDDPRAPHTLMRTDADLRERLPLGAQKMGIDTLERWARRRHEAALEVQRASLDVRDYYGLRLKLRRMRRRLQNWRALLRRPRWNPNW